MIHDGPSRNRLAVVEKLVFVRRGAVMDMKVIVPEFSAGCSKRPDFSPAQPWQLFHPPALNLPRQPLRPGTRLVPSKAATLRMTLFHASRLTAPLRARSWRTFSASCSSHMRHAYLLLAGKVEFTQHQFIPEHIPNSYWGSYLLGLP